MCDEIDKKIDEILKQPHTEAQGNIIRAIGELEKKYIIENSIAKTSEKKTTLLQRIRKRLAGKHECPAYWWEQGWEDCDEGCLIPNNAYPNCWKCKWRFVPKFIVRIILKKIG